jgi:hypothetical protein
MGIDATEHKKTAILSPVVTEHQRSANIFGSLGGEIALRM